MQFCFFDTAAGLGGILRAEYRPRDRSADATLTLFVADGAVATVLAKQRDAANGSTPVGRIHLERAQPMGSWYLRCKDTALVFPGAGVTGLPKQGERTGVGAQVELDVTFESWSGPHGSVERATEVDEMGFVRVMSSGHFEQPGRYHGRVRVGGRQVALEATGVRTRTWGVRDPSATHPSKWLAVAFAPTLVFSARGVSIGERDMRSGWIRSGDETFELDGFHLETDHQGRAPAAVRLSVAHGETRHDLAGEALVSLPMREGNARVYQTLMRYRCGDREALGLAEYIDG